MEWRFGDFVLNSDRAELTGPDGPAHVERTPLDVLIHLAANAERVVTRDELIDTCWDGRIVSDATISTAVKQARRAVGDTGAAQAVIRTVHGRGFRFVAPLEAVAFATPAAADAVIAPPVAAPGSGRPGIAVLRFHLLGGASRSVTLAEALPAELILGLSRVRWLHVIARSSSFRFDPVSYVPGEVGALLGVRYLMSGTIEVVGEMLTISVEILEAGSGGVVWSDRFAASFSDVHTARGEIVAAVMSALEIEIPQHEAQHARRLTPAEFDAWSHFHLGLAHVYRYNQQDNRIAARHFSSALELDPGFGRAHAGLSFTHWQNAFMQFGEDRRTLLGLAAGEAAQALEIDAADPFANYNMGRARWLEGDLDASLSWLDRALGINGNFAQCHYARGLLLTLDGAASGARDAAARAISLSPLDPLHYGMVAVQAMSHIATEDFGEARRLAERAVQTPGAHFYIEMIAAAACALDGDLAAAGRLRDRALAMRPDLSQAMFFAAFPFKMPDMRDTLAGAFGRLGIT